MTGRGTVLVVEDDEMIRELVTTLLDANGYFTRTATNGLDALHEFDRVDPDLIVLDMHLPVLDGWGFAHALTERGLRPTILVLTTIDAQCRAEQIGADGWLGKPFELEGLLAEVRRLCGLAGGAMSLPDREEQGTPNSAAGAVVASGGPT
jgi:DNA-binding response OmpR family regulator